MPYISQEHRTTLEPGIEELKDAIYSLPSEDINSILTYICYYLVVYYCEEGNWDKKSDALKILEDAKLEYYRRVLTPHANLKIKENGDI